VGPNYLQQPKPNSRLELGPGMLKSLSISSILPEVGHPVQVPSGLGSGEARFRLTSILGAPALQNPNTPVRDGNAFY